MQKRLFGSILILTILLLYAETLFCNDPPERIWYMEAPRVTAERTSQYFYDFAWIGDQNGDGCDEILITQEPWLRGDGPNDPLNRVEMYLGDPEQISEEPDFIFEAQDSLEIMAYDVSYIGALTAENARDFAIYTRSYIPDNGGSSDVGSTQFYIYRGGEGRFDTDPDFKMGRIYENGNSIRFLGLEKPFDINNDGFHDILVREYQEYEPTLHICFGGSNFDTIPDFTMDYCGMVQEAGDLNGDGYDDLLMFQGNSYVLFGGDPPEGEPELLMAVDGYDGYQIGEVRIIPDVNDDDYDDILVDVWQIDNPYGHRSWIYFGDDELDLNREPDRSLEYYPGPVYGAGKPEGALINSDNIGDIQMRNDVMHFYFGSPWFDTTPSVSWLEREFRELRKSLAAYGDFNGDGTGDCAIVAHDGAGTPNDYNRMAIYASRPDWIVSVPGSNKHRLPANPELTGSSYPNPFNNQTTVKFNLPFAGDLTLKLYDTQGRKLKAFQKQRMDAGQQTFNILGTNLPSGILILTATLESRSQILKNSLKLVHLN